MTQESVLSLFEHALRLILILQGIILVPALIAGLLISMLQAATQINEMTLSFIPKLFVTAAVFVLAGPWMLDYLLDYTRRLINDIPYLIG